LTSTLARTASLAESLIGLRIRVQKVYLQLYSALFTGIYLSYLWLESSQMLESFRAALRVI
jgi:hypothetical protein